MTTKRDPEAVDPRWVTIREAAARLGVTDRWVSKLIGQGKLTAKLRRPSPTSLRGVTMIPEIEVARMALEKEPVKEIPFASTAPAERKRSKR